MSEETVDTGTLQANEDRLRLAVLATLAVTSIIDVYLLAISASTLSLVPWLLLTLACIVIVGLNVRCLLVSGPTMGMIPIALIAILPAALAAYAGPCLPRGIEVLREVYGHVVGVCGHLLIHVCALRLHGLVVPQARKRLRETR